MNNNYYESIARPIARACKTVFAAQIDVVRMPWEMKALEITTGLFG
jgi:hypothetical protein